ncbi:MAG: zinc-binding dehydrogenase, partial [Acidobacteriota bacterium]
GGEVSGFEPGDRVCSPFTTNCGSCFYCRCGLTCRCVSGQLFGWVEDGRGLQGAQAEYVRVPLADSTLLEPPEEMLQEEALLLGDILSTGYFCAEQAGVSGEGTYAVVGCGPVGLMTLIGARELGAKNLFGVDSVPERLALASRLGATAVDYLEDDPVTRVKEATDGRGADAVMEVVGSAAATFLAIAMLRPGGVLSSVGVHTEAQFGFSPVQAYDKNLTLKSGRCPARHYMERLVPLVQSRSDELAAVISHRLPLEDGARGYEIFDNKLEGCTKVILEP